MALQFIFHPSVCDKSDWERWLDFFAEAVKTAAAEGLSALVKLDALLRRDRLSLAILGRASKSASLVYETMLRHPIVSANTLREKTKMSDATVNAALRNLQRLGIVEETTGRQRDRLFRYRQYMELLTSD